MGRSEGGDPTPQRQAHRKRESRNKLRDSRDGQRLCRLRGEEALGLRGPAREPRSTTPLGVAQHAQNRASERRCKAQPIRRLGRKFAPSALPNAPNPTTKIPNTSKPVLKDQNPKA